MVPLQSIRESGKLPGACVSAALPESIVQELAVHGLLEMGNCPLARVTRFTIPEASKNREQFDADD